MDRRRVHGAKPAESASRQEQCMAQWSWARYHTLSMRREDVVANSIGVVEQRMGMQAL